MRVKEGEMGVEGERRALKGLELIFAECCVMSISGGSRRLRGKARGDESLALHLN